MATTYEDAKKILLDAGSKVLKENDLADFKSEFEAENGNLTMADHTKALTVAFTKVAEEAGNTERLKRLTFPVVPESAGEEKLQHVLADTADMVVRNKHLLTPMPPTDKPLRRPPQDRDRRDDRGNDRDRGGRRDDERRGGGAGEGRRPRPAPEGQRQPAAGQAHIRQLLAELSGWWQAVLAIILVAMLLATILAWQQYGDGSVVTTPSTAGGASSAETSDPILEQLKQLSP